jgi:hypothetical protein
MVTTRSRSNSTTALPTSGSILKLKRQTKVQKQLLRRKLTGIGVAIQVSSGILETEPTHRKIVFDDVVSKEGHDDIGGDNPTDEQQSKENFGTQKEDDDDDDSLVEEVMGSSQAKDQLRLEAEQIRVAQRAAVKQKKKRRTAKNQVTTEDDNTGFDHDFFHQLEEEHLRRKKRKLLKSRDMNDKKKQCPKHTTFVVRENDMVEDHVVEQPHNIQVVVLSHDEHITSEPVSDMMYLYSRCGFIDPNIAPNAAINEKLSKKRCNAKPVASVATWTRSNKMNHILSVPSRVRRKGKPAMQFANKSRG